MSRKWSVLAFLCGIFVIYTVDRALLGLLAIPIQQETGLSDVRFGLLGSAIFWTYALAVPFAGLAGDRFDRSRLIGLAALAWSAMTFLAGFADGFWSLLALVSFAIVVPQTLYSPAANALIASLHDKTRTVAMSCHQAAFYTGWFVSGAAVAGISAFFGTWRAVFFACGGVGIASALAFLWFSRRERVDRSSSCDRSSRDSIAIGQSADQSIKQSLRAYFGCPSALLVSVGYVTEVFVACGYCAWGPKFVANKFALSAGAAGTGVMFWHYAAAFAAILGAGFLTDACVKRWPRFRLALSLSATVVAVPALLLFGLGTSLLLVWTGAALLGAMLGVIGANQFTNLFDVVPSAFRSGAIGFLTVMAGLCGGLSPVLLGALSEAAGLRGFERGFALFAAVQALPIAALAACILFTFRKDRLVES